MKSLSGLQKISVATFLVMLAGGAYFFYSSRASTEIALTLTTNADLERGLVGHWTFDGSDVDWSSTTAEIRDRSGQGNHGNATTTMSATTSPTGGVLGQGLLFDGIDDAIFVDDSADFDVGTGDMTVGAWVLRPSNPSNNYCGIASHTTGTLATDGWWFTLDNDPVGSDAVNFAMNDVDHFVTSPVENLAQGYWAHVMAVKNGNAITHYINGVVQGTIDNGTSINNSSGKFRIGMEGSSYGSQFCDGSIDDVRFYNRALSADEVKRIYGLGATTKVAETITTNPTLDTGLVGHWTFDGEYVDWSSTTAEIRDRSGQGNHGNATTTMSAQSVAEGVLGQGLYLDGTANSLVSIPYSSSLQPTDAISFGGWFIFSTTTLNQYLINKQEGASPTRGWILELWNGRVGATAYTGAAWYNASTSDYALNEWQHVFGTYSATAGQIDLYLNGLLVASEPAADGSIVYPVANQPLCLGSDRNSTTYECGRRYYFPGRMDDVRIYNRALSAEEVKRLYQLGATTKIAETITTNTTLETGLVGHWTFDGADVDWSSTTAEIRDRSGQGNHGNATTTMSAQSVAEGVLGQGISLDGIGDFINIEGTNSDNFTTYSVTGWGKVDNTNGSYKLVDKDYNFSVNFNDNVGGSYCEHHDGTGWQDVSHTTNFSTSTWGHMACVFDGTTLYLYINGALVNSAGVNPPTTDNTNIYIGARSRDPVIGFFDGAIDDVRIYNRALSADEVRRLYDLGQ